MHDVLDPDDGGAARHGCSRMVSTSAWHSPSVSRRRSRRAAAAAGRSRARAPAPAACARAASASRRARWRAASRPVCSRISPQQCVDVALALCRGHGRRRPADSRTRSDSRTAAGSGRSGRCRRCSADAAACAVMSRPSRRIVPASGARPPAIRLNSVVLPAPFGPMMPSASPGRNAKDRCSSAATTEPKACADAGLSSIASRASRWARTIAPVPPTTAPIRRSAPSCRRPECSARSGCR